MAEEKLNLTGDSLAQTMSSDIEYVEPENGILITYANFLEYGFTPGDMRIVFGELINFSKGKATVEQRVQVTMSWLQAKVLAAIVNNLVATHEKENGVIRVPPHLLNVSQQ